MQWYEAPEGETSDKVFAYIAGLESAQSELYERFLKLAVLYDPHDISGLEVSWDRGRGPMTQVSENFVATNVDSVNAVIAVTDVRARFMTDDADWGAQRLARHLEWYAEGLDKLLDGAEVCRRAFKDASLKGTGLVKVYINSKDKICVERVMVDDIRVDEVECRVSGKPRQMHHVMVVPKEKLIAEFPEHEEQIGRAQGGSSGSTWRQLVSYRQFERDDVLVVESWYLGQRHVISIDGCELVHEEFNEEEFPIVRVIWSERDKGWHGIGLGERLAGRQREVNKLNFQEDACRDRFAVPTTWVRMADANIAVRSVNQLGRFGVYKDQPPITVIPQGFSNEGRARRQELNDGSYEETGMSRLGATGAKPAGLDSGVALREYRDQTTQRFAIQEKYWERFRLAVIVRMLDCCKKLGSKAPVITRHHRFGAKKIPWGKVDPVEIRVQIAAASTLSRTPAGRLQLVMEFAQGGLISMDEARRLIRHPDLERAMSLYTSALEDIEYCLEEILDGKDMAPEPFQNLKMLVWRGQQEYLKVRSEDAPEEILEALREYITNAAFLLSMQGQDPAMAQMQGGPEQVAPTPAIAPEAIGVTPA